MDIILYIVVAGVCFLAGRISAPKTEVPTSEMTDKERTECYYQSTLNQSLLTEVQQYRALENKRREEIWQLKTKLKKLQQNN